MKKKLEYRVVFTRKWYSDFMYSAEYFQPLGIFSHWVCISKHMFQGTAEDACEEHARKRFAGPKPKLPKRIVYPLGKLPKD